MNSKTASLTADEMRQIVQDFNRTGTEYPDDKTVHQLFERQVDRTPHDVAVVTSHRNQVITYQELNRRANQLARILRERGVVAETVVSLMVERSIEMVTGMLAVLKAGGAYLPISADFPDSRKRFVGGDSDAAILITQERLWDKNRRLFHHMESENILLVDGENIFCGEGTNLALPGRPDHIAYIMYTSGTTGKPKGVVVEHRSVVNVVTWFAREYNLQTGVNVLYMSDYTFDASVNQVFGSLLYGSTLHIIDRDLRIDIDSLRQYIENNRIHVINFVPSLLGELLGEGEKLKSLKIVLCGAEKLEDEVKDKIIGKGYLLYNHYGPTETTIDALSSKCSEERVTLGRPIANVRCYILDDGRRVVPLHTTGELYISGAGVARGYLNRPCLTSEKFLVSPFERGERLYRTGDLGAWMSAGNVEFYGRGDHQVKIRGYRIELGEIESCLLNHRDIKETVVTVQDGDQHLCAYLVSRKNIDISELREYLSAKLPAFMIPSFFVSLERLPMTGGGKVDRGALPRPELMPAGSGYAAPRNDVEEKLQEIWSRVLRIDRRLMGIDTDFFEIGGHSLRAARFLSILHQAFNIRISLEEIFRRSTIRKLSEYMKHAVSNRHVSIRIAEKKEYYPMSSSQRRLFILAQMSTDSTSYNLPALFVLEMRPDRRRLEEAFMKLIKRHESFRTSFELAGDEAVQRVHEAVDFEIEYCAAAYSAHSTKPIKDFIKPFDLAKAPLLRVALKKTVDSTPTLLLVDIHHIVCDGTSMEIFRKELPGLYDLEDLPPLKLQYRDFSEWQNREKKNREIEVQESYWLAEFFGEVPVLNLPIDYPRPVVQSFAGCTQTFRLGVEYAEAAKGLARGEDATLYMFLLTVFNILLVRLGNQEDIVIGTPTAGRNHCDLDPIIGMFVNTLALRNFPAGNKRFDEFLKEVKVRTLAAFENEDYPFEELVDKVTIPRDTSRNPLFDIMFVFHNMETRESNGGNLKLTAAKFKGDNSKFDMSLIARESAGGSLDFELEYCTSLFKPETVDRFIHYFCRIFSAVLEDPGREISQIEIISEQEKRQLLFDFNHTQMDWPEDPCLHDLFESQVAKVPENTAIEGPRISSPLTYRELNERANQLARVLSRKGMRVNDIVGVLVERSVEMVVGILAILKVGGAYLPLVPDYPHERIIYMLKDSGAEWLLLQARYQERFNGGIGVVNLENPDLYNGVGENLKKNGRAGDLAYIIYTSGSTGKPKGVLVEHRSAVNVSIALEEKFPVSDTGRYLLKTSFIFDVSVTELFGWFWGGGRLVILAPGGEKDPREMIDIIEAFKITHINFVPPMFKAFVDQLDPHNVGKLSSLRYIFLAGEALLPELINKFNRLKTNIPLENLYGPTEGTVYASHYPLSIRSDQMSVPIGRPLANVKLYVLDRHGKAQPLGVSGELYISGAGVARGYINNPESTAERFMVTPFSAGERLYRTGDFARWLPDGNIEFLGRLDHQVKIRGYRIELAEIENHLLNHREIREAVVVVREDEGEEKYLCAYYVAPKDFSVSELREYLSPSLPDYMIPSYFVPIDKIPLTPSGKLDRKALPEDKLFRPKLDISYAPPNTGMEKILTEIWQEVLKVERVGIHDRFFDLGGNSMKLIRVGSKLKEKINRDIPVVTMFRFSTISYLASYLRDTETDEAFVSQPKDRIEAINKAKNRKKERIRKGRSYQSG